MCSSRMWLLVVLISLHLASAQYGNINDPVDLTPRYHLRSTPQHQGKRQNNLCATNAHSCMPPCYPQAPQLTQHPGLDINANVCCANDQYCMISPDLRPSCCAIGSDCGVKLCNTSQYICAATITKTGVASTTATCCQRSCPTTSQFKCAAAYGGGCCGYGSQCASGGACVSTVMPTASAIVPVLPSGCAISCPSSLGGGCCGIGSSCTVSNQVNYCAAATGSATRTGASGITITVIPLPAEPSSSLSTGAKAGVGAGAAIGACIISGGLLWFCLWQRRRSKQRRQSEPSITTVLGGDVSQVSETGIRGLENERQTSDYFGSNVEHSPYAMSPTSPTLRSPGGLPSGPNSPGDITTPVEIDSRNHSNVTSPGDFEHTKTVRSTSYPIEMP